MQDALYIAIEDRETQAVTITGEAGVDKSRLLYEFSAWSELLPNRPRIFQGRSDPQMQNLPYSLVRDMLSTRFDILDSDPPAVAREKLVQGIRGILASTGLPLDVTQEKAGFIGYLAGLDFSGSPYISGILDDAKQIRNRTFRYVVDFFRAVTLDIPAIIMLEDLHWADDGSLDLIAHLMRECPHAPLLIVGMARTVLYERRPRWGEGLESHSRIDLHPLTKRDSRRLVADILRKLPDIPSVLQELIVGGAEANPFYLEELIKMLIDERLPPTLR